MLLTNTKAALQREETDYATNDRRKNDEKVGVFLPYLSTFVQKYDSDTLEVLIPCLANLAIYIDNDGYVCIGRLGQGHYSVQCSSQSAGVLDLMSNRSRKQKYVEFHEFRRSLSPTHCIKQSQTKPLPTHNQIPRSPAFPHLIHI